MTFDKVSQLKLKSEMSLSLVEKLSESSRIFALK
jgi:hypothetical protein